METRGVVADWIAGDKSSHRSTPPPRSRTCCARWWRRCWACPRTACASITPEVGGGFGSKLNVYAEEALMGFVAMKIGKPVKWIESRRENFHCTIHGRGHVDYYEIAAKRDGTVLGMQAQADSGPGRLSSTADARHPDALGADDAGPVQVPEHSADIVGVFTNCVPTDAYRGAGRPEATHGIERMMDMLAAELKMDPAELRLKNFIGNDEFPYATATGLSYDSGNYAAPLKKALGHGGLPQAARGAAEGARRRPADGHRHFHLRRNLRLRPVARHARRRMGKRHGEDRALRQGHRDDRRLAARPGRGDHLRADRRRRTRRATSTT